MDQIVHFKWIQNSYILALNVDFQKSDISLANIMLLAFEKMSTPRSYGGSIFRFLRNYHNVLHSGCTNLPEVQEGSIFPTSSLSFVICKSFDDGHSDWCEVIPHCSFDLHFSNNQRKPYFRKIHSSPFLLQHYLQQSGH